MFQPSGFAALATAAALFACVAPAALAQETCLSFRAITPLAWDNKVASYVGPVYATLGDNVLIGKSLASDEQPATSCDAMSCQDTGGRWRLDFGQGDTLTIQLHTAVYTVPGGFGVYYSTEKIAAGTGKFEKATGMLHEFGPFVAWTDAKGDIQAQYNGELGGSICGPKLPKKAPAAALPAPGQPSGIHPFFRDRLSPAIRTVDNHPHMP